FREQEIAGGQQILGSKSRPKLEHSLGWHFEGARALRHVRLLGEDELGAASLDQEPTVQSQVASADKPGRSLLFKRLDGAKPELCLDPPWAEPRLGSYLTGPTECCR